MSLQPNDPASSKRLESLERRAALLARAERTLLSTNAIAGYRPYPKQRLFHKHGIDKDERLLMAANQVGKTFCAAAEVSYHLTGDYPDWWEGRVWDRPTRWWAGGVTQETTRDSCQKLLLGEPSDQKQWGTGSIPKRHIIRIVNARGIPNSVNSIVVKHKSGKGNSVIVFKNYEQGQQKWMSETLDGIWCDEEPPQEIYNECLPRVAKQKGIIMVTFTPLLGMSEVVRMFLNDSDVKGMLG